MSGKDDKNDKDPQKSAKDAASSTDKPAASESTPAASPSAGLERFSAATKESREAAKWLVAGFGAIGAALVAGSQLSSIGALDDPTRLLVAIIALGVGLAAAGAGAAITMWVLLPGYTTLAAIAKQEESGKSWWKLAYFGDVVTESPDVGEGYATSVAGSGGLLPQLRSAMDRRAARYSDYLKALEDGAPDVAVKERNFEVADARLAELARVASGVVAAASYRRLNRGVRPWVGGIVAFALIIGVSLGVFAWAANPADADEADGDTSVALRGVVIVGADLSGRDLTGVDFGGATLKDVNLRGAKLDPDRLANVVWQDVICPDGVSSGPTGSCLGHLE